jgi:hypothetical protein
MKYLIVKFFGGVRPYKQNRFPIIFTFNHNEFHCIATWYSDLVHVPENLFRFSERFLSEPAVIIPARTTEG